MTPRHYSLAVKQREAEPGEEEGWYELTSPHYPGLLLIGPYIRDLLSEVPPAIEALSRAYETSLICSEKTNED